jgi:alpha/beta superfamily hydrolase
MAQLGLMRRQHMEISFVSGNENLQATLYGQLSATSSAGVVLCPPHPLHGGSRHDTRLVAVARALSKNALPALCMDYGSYGGGIREIQHVLDAAAFMRGKGVSSLGLLGYSFGSVVASNAAATAEADGFVAMSILRRINDLTAKLDSECPKLFVHGKRDNLASYADFEYLYAEAKGSKQKLVLDTDHFYMDNYPTVINTAAEATCRFFQESFKKSDL